MTLCKVDANENDDKKTSFYLYDSFQNYQTRGVKNFDRVKSIANNTRIRI